MVKSTPAKPKGRHKAFADIASEFFSKAEMAYIREMTFCGPSVLDVVRQAVREAARNRAAAGKAADDEELYAGIKAQRRIAVNGEINAC